MNIMNDDHKKLAVDIDKLNVDWNKQAVGINEKITRGVSKEKNRRWALGLTGLAVVIVAVFAIVLFHRSGVDDESLNYADQDSDIPYGFYVLNGFTEESNSFEQTVNFVLAEEGDQL